jgi:hypothetical protein
MQDIDKCLRGPTKHIVGQNIIMHKDLVVGGNLYAGNLIIPRIQPNIIVKGSLADVTTNWGNKAKSDLTLSSYASAPPTESANSIRITTNVIGTDDPDIDYLIWFTFNEVQDLSFLDYLGFYFRGYSNVVYKTTDITVHLFNLVPGLDVLDDDTTLLKTMAVDSYNWKDYEYTTPASPNWEYSEIALNPARRKARNAIKAIGFSFQGMKDDTTFDLHKIDIYKLGTKYGPVRGIIMALPLESGESVVSGDLTQITTNGAIKSAEASTQTFVGQVVRDQVLTMEGYEEGYESGSEDYRYVVVNGVIHAPFPSGGGVIASGDSVKVASSKTSAKTVATVDKIGVVMKEIPDAGGIYPVFIGLK